MGGSEESFLDEGELDFFPDDYFEEPTPALKGYRPDYRHSKCPAFKEYYKNTWVMKQSFPLGILYKSTEQYLETNLGQDVFDEYFMLGDGWTDGDIQRYNSNKVTVFGQRTVTYGLNSFNTLK